MQAINFAAAASPVFGKPKGIAPWLSTAADMHQKYFSDEPTNLSLDQVRQEVIRDNTHLPLRELAAILVLMEKQYSDMNVKRGH